MDAWEFRPLESTKFISFATLYYTVTVNAKQVRHCHSRLLNAQDVRDLADTGVRIPEWLMQKSEPVQKMQELDYLFADGLSAAEFDKRHREYKRGLAA